MDIKNILELIIKHGCCSWILDQKQERWKDICDKCPLSKMNKTPDGRWESCIETICGSQAHNMTPEQVRQRYSTIALRILTDILVDEMIDE